MSPTSTEQNELQQPDAHAPVSEPNHDRENDRDMEDRRGFFQKNPLAKPFAFLVIATLVLAVGWYWWDSRHWESTDDAQIDGHIYPISARVGGQVIKVNVDDGQFVHKGDVLVVTDPTDYKVALDRAQADYQEAQASAEAAQFGVPISSAGSSQQIRSASADMSNAQAGVSAAQKQVEAAQAQVAEAQALAQKLNADVGRYRMLLDKKEISQQQFDQATSSATAANATVKAREASLLAARAQVLQAESRIEQAHAELQNAQVSPKQVQATQARAKSADAQVLRYKSALDQAQLNLNYTTIVAPVDGIVGKRSVQVGQNVAPGQDMMAIVPLRDIWVTANFKETQLDHMQPGQPVKVKVDTYGGRKWNAHVTSIGAATGAKYSLLPPENATGNYVKVVQRIPVRIDFDNSDKPDFNQDGLLRPGMSVTPDVNVSVRPDNNNSKK
ncbi:MAG TPA: HlyD family secretion protein [Terriglobales bacterium]